MKFHDSLVILHEQMLDDELSPVGQNLGELCEGSRQEVGFRLVVTGQRMRAFDDPVDLVVYMLEKARAIAFLKILENHSDVVFGDHRPLRYLPAQPVHSHWFGRLSSKQAHRSPMSATSNGAGNVPC